MHIVFQSIILLIFSSLNTSNSGPYSAKHLNTDMKLFTGSLTAHDSIESQRSKMITKDTIYGKDLGNHNFLHYINFLSKKLETEIGLAHVLQYTRSAQQLAQKG